MLFRVVLMTFLPMACASAGAIPDDHSPANGAPPLAGRVSMPAVHAKALEGNRLGGTTGRIVIVYSPPSRTWSVRRRSIARSRRTACGTNFGRSQRPRGFRPHRQGAAPFVGRTLEGADVTVQPAPAAAGDGWATG